MNAVDSEKKDEARSKKQEGMRNGFQQTPCPMLIPMLMLMLITMLMLVPVSTMAEMLPILVLAHR